jgi:hypothetical protein
MKPGKSTHFKLEKLYLDCIDEQGNCFIIYWAKLKFYFIKVIYSGLIFSDNKGVTIEKSSLKKMREPLINNLLLFYSQYLEIRGSWERTADQLPVFSFNDALKHELAWNCHHPKALTEIQYNDTTFEGFGYAETLTLTIKPWNLPIEELRWGRFLTDLYAITWINWKGDNPLNKIYCNGEEYNDAIFQENSIIFGSGAYVLMFNEITIIRKGRLRNALSNMPWIKIFFNPRILNTMEIKYKAKSTLVFNSEISASGWSLFEIVTWEKQK